MLANIVHRHVNSTAFALSRRETMVQCWLRRLARWACHVFTSMLGNIVGSFSFPSSTGQRWGNTEDNVGPILDNKLYTWSSSCRATLLWRSSPTCMSYLVRWQIWAKSYSALTLRLIITANETLMSPFLNYCAFKKRPYSSSFHLDCICHLQHRATAT